VLNIPKSTLYRRRKNKVTEKKTRKKGTGQFRALSQVEKSKVMEVLHDESNIDKSPMQVYHEFLDKGVYLCSVSTMYRILRENKEVKERRNITNRRHYKKPELLATEPNKVWSWDITKLRSTKKWHYYYLYVMLDIYSRYVVGWMLEKQESGELGKQLIEETCKAQNINKSQLIIHSDRGAPMKSKTVAQLLSDLEVGKSFSRPSVSNDNPFSEAQFKTLKYCPQFPGEFRTIQEARLFCQEFFEYYNTKHYHSGIKFFIPETVHYKSAEQVIKKRTDVVVEAYRTKPQRFVKGVTKIANVPDAVWINQPMS